MSADSSRSPSFARELKYRGDIDGLRAIAVVPVVLYHYGVRGFAGGFVGVDIFFVISGFLITSLIFSEMREGRFSITAFYQRRARRILPALFLVIGCAFGAAIAIMFPRDLMRFGRGSSYALLRANYLVRNAFVLGSLASLKAKHEATIANPAEVLCSGAQCDLARDGRPLYSDHHHLSVFGAEQLVGLFRAQLEVLRRVPE